MQNIKNNVLNFPIQRRKQAQYTICCRNLIIMGKFISIETFTKKQVRRITIQIIDNKQGFIRCLFGQISIHKSDQIDKKLSINEISDIMLSAQLFRVEDNKILINDGIRSLRMAVSEVDADAKKLGWFQTFEMEQLINNLKKWNKQSKQYREQNVRLKQKLTQKIIELQNNASKYQQIQQQLDRLKNKNEKMGINNPEQIYKTNRQLNEQILSIKQQYKNKNRENINLHKDLDKKIDQINGLKQKLKQNETKHKQQLNKNARQKQSKQIKYRQQINIITNKLNYKQTLNSKFKQQIKQLNILTKQQANKIKLTQKQNNQHISSIQQISQMNRLYQQLCKINQSKNSKLQSTHQIIMHYYTKNVQILQYNQLLYNRLFSLINKRQCVRGNLQNTFIKSKRSIQQFRNINNDTDKTIKECKNLSSIIRKLKKQLNQVSQIKKQHLNTSNKNDESKVFTIQTITNNNMSQSQVISRNQIDNCYETFSSKNEPYCQTQRYMNTPSIYQAKGIDTTSSKGTEQSYYKPSSTYKPPSVPCYQAQNNRNQPPIYQVKGINTTSSKGTEQSQNKPSTMYKPSVPCYQAQNNRNQLPIYQAKGIDTTSSKGTEQSYYKPSSMYKPSVPCYQAQNNRNQPPIYKAKGIDTTSRKATEQSYRNEPYKSVQKIKPIQMIDLKKNYQKVNFYY